MTNRRRRRTGWIAAALLASALTACGGGGSEGHAYRPDHLDGGVPESGKPTSDHELRDQGGDGAAPDRPDAVAPDGRVPDVRPPDLLDRDAGAAPDTRDPSAMPVPVLWIEVDGKPITETMKIPGRLKVIDEHDGSHSNLASARASLTTAIGIELRGNYTATLPKKPYGFEFRDDAAAQKDLPLLGMPAGSDWVLYACYSDKTCLRNALAYDVGQALGRYNPRFRFVELYLDGKYQGLYNVVEKIRRGKNRLDIPRPAGDSKGDMSGGYIFRHEGSGAGPRRDWRSATGIIWTYDFPRYDEVSAQQKKYLQDLVDKFEGTMKGADWAHAQRGYRAQIDVASWVDYALMQELSRNWDGYVRSAYFWKAPAAKGNLIHAGPLWDFDLAFGNLGIGDSYKTDGWAHTKPTRTGYDAVPFFFEKLWSDPAFQKEARCRWEVLRDGPLSRSAIDAKLRAWAKYIEPAVKRDAAKWKLFETKLPTAYYNGKTYDEELEWLREWVRARINWLDANLPGKCN